MTHAKLSPSSSSRWLTCTASVRACEAYENKTNEYAEWGTLAHEVGECLLLNKPIPPDATPEHIECATEYADYVHSLMSKHSVLIVEETFDLGFIMPNQFGTSDATVLTDRHLHIVDLKTGHNIVDAENNTQLMLYALGALNDLETIYDIDEITLHIVQTRANHISSWTLSVSDLLIFGQVVAIQAQKILNNKDTEFNPNAKACKYCPHQYKCEALKLHVEGVIKGSFDNIEDIEGKADMVDVSHIKRILDNKDLIIGFIKAVEEVALERLQKGDKIDGYKVVASNTNRKWADEDEVEKYLKGRLKASELYVKKLVPMTKILKLLPDDKKLQGMLIKPEGQPTIAKADDKRPSLTDVKDKFENIKG